MTSMEAAGFEGDAETAALGEDATTGDIGRS